MRTCAIVHGHDHEHEHKTWTCMQTCAIVHGHDHEHEHVQLYISINTRTCTQTCTWTCLMFISMYIVMYKFMAIRVEYENCFWSVRTGQLTKGQVWR